ncbi:MAG: hypothetical protein ABIM46_04835, partial [candidate division WOR-3 bacterium]
LVIKLNPNGSLAWARTFGGTGYDDASSITQTSDGGYAVAGHTDGFGAGNFDILVIKLNPNGSLAWARTFGGTGYDDAPSIIQTSDGGYAVAGYTVSFGAGNFDILVIKLNPNGSLAWARTFGGIDGDWAESIIRTSDGGYAVAGATWSFGAGNDDFLVLKLNSNGSLAWARTYGGTGYEAVSSIIQITDGGYAVAGDISSFGPGDVDLLVLKLNPDGSPAWARTYVMGTDYDWVYSITQTSDGGYAVAGETESFGAGGDDFFVLKLNSNGSLAWARTFGGISSDDAHSITQTSDGGYAVAGHTGSFGAGGDFLVLKLGSDGNYPGCVQECSPTVGTFSLITSSPSVSVTTCSPQTSSPSPTITTPSLTITDVCPPAVEERDVYNRPKITCSPVPGAALFISPYDIGIKIYKADGRLVYSGELHEGENRIPLEPGVYIWTTRNPQPVTRNQSGKIGIIRR